METTMKIAERPTAREKHFREMAVWHEWPIDDEEFGASQLKRMQNVGSLERWISTLLGGSLAALGVTKKSNTAMSVAALVGALVYRAVSGHCRAYGSLKINNALPGMAEPVYF